MSLLKPQLLAERIVYTLKNGALRGPALLERLEQEFREDYTKQAMYTGLRQLIHEDVVVKQRGKYALNTTWILQLQTFIAEAGIQYGAMNTGSEILTLKPGESVAYTFSTVQTLDTFWGHVQNLLLAKTPKSEPVYAYNPHYWFLLAHGETEQILLRHIAESGRQFLMTVGNSTALDKEIGKSFDGTATQCAYARLFDEEERYLSSIGDFVISVTLDETTAARVQDVFERFATATPEAVDTLRAILKSQSRGKIKISHAPRRAKEFRTKLKKYFFIRARQ